ncbi:MAG: sulfotransferase family protein [Pseudomonadota bacterium]
MSEQEVPQSSIEERGEIRDGRRKEARVGSHSCRVVAILGMHRSGTSCLTGTLQQAGMFLGEVHTWNRYNTRGNRESQSFVDLNEEILSSNGAAWDRPPESCQWSEEQRTKARQLVSALRCEPMDGYGVHTSLEDGGGTAVVGFKDPRTLLTIDGWLQAIPELEFVGVFRSPMAVANSLAFRNEMPSLNAFRLWSDYNRRLLALHRRFGFPLLDFDVDEHTYSRLAVRAASHLGLQAERITEAPFFEETLRQSQRSESETPLPYRLKLLHWRLKRRALRAGSPP